MLTAMRDGAHSKIIKYVLFSFLMLAALGMAMMDVGGFFRNGGVSNSAIASIGRENIGITSFDNTLRRTLAQQGMSPQEAYQFGVVDQILESQIANTISAQNALEMGFYVGDGQVAQQMNSFLAPLEKPDMSKREVLRRILQNQGMSEGEFISQIRAGIMGTLVENTIQAAASATSDYEARALYLYRNETRDIEGFMLKNDSVKEIEPAPDDVLKALYEASKGLRFQIPEERSFTIAILDKESLKSSITIADEDLKEEYDTNIAAYTVPERRVVQQAVVANEEEAKKLIEAVKGGKNLKAAAGKKYQGDQTYDQNGMDPTMAEAVFKAQPNEPVGPFKSPLGWSVMVVEKTLPEEVKSFDSVKKELRDQVMNIRLADDLFNTANAIDDRLAAGEELETIASELHLKTRKIGPVRMDGTTPTKNDALKDFESDREAIMKSAFDMNEGEAAPVQEISGGRYAAVRVDTVKASAFRPYEDVKAELAKDWRTDQLASANKTRATRAQQDVASGKESLSVLANGFGSKVETFSGVKKTGDAPKGMNEATIDALFSAVPGETVAAPVPGGYLIATIKSVKMPDESKVAAKDLETISGMLDRTSGEELNAAYKAYLRNKMSVKVNRRLLDSLYGPGSGTQG